ncbi:unnamed protein product [Durusdinium trenchii]|uniref:EF-hand domain-containing protein n=1 Tax=Durusdinium trenchii TaxID=1381693 RepID=A0ABP0KWQ4_9DINO
MSQLELEYHDLLSLFEFLDNGDGEITLMEFVEGAGRLKGRNQGSKRERAFLDGSGAVKDLICPELKEENYTTPTTWTKQETKMEACKDEVQKRARKLYSYLVSLVKGRPLRIIRSVTSNDGFKACQPKTRQRELGIIQALVAFPQFDRGKILEGFIKYDELVGEYELAGTCVDKNLKIATVRECSSGTRLVPRIWTVKGEPKGKGQIGKGKNGSPTGKDGGRGVGQLVADEVFGKHGAQFDSLQEWWESDNMVERSDLTMPDGDRMWTLVEPDMEMDYEDIFENVNFINLAKLKPQMDYEALFIICAPPFLWGTLSLDICRECGEIIALKEVADDLSHGSIRADRILNALSSQDLKVKLDDEGDASYSVASVPVNYSDLSRFQKLQKFLQSDRYEMIIAIVLCVNVLLMAFELQIDGSVKGYEQGIIGYVVVPSEAYPGWESAFKTVDLIFTLFFAADVILRVCVLKSKFFKAFVNYIDLAVCVTTLMEVTLYYMVTLPVSPILFRLLRIGKLSRAIRMVTMHSVLQSLHLLIKCLTASTNMLFWSFCLLTFFQCVSGLVISTLCRDFIRDTSQPLELRRSVWLYYGTFTRTFLSMFEILFANWSPPCRILVDEVSESFAVFFLIYRCLLGFAVLNVVNAVFVQQTMKTASSDEELAFKQKERDLELFTRKVKKLFRTVDESGDGLINKDEFSKLVKDPMLNFWLGQLELEYHDLMGLFEFLDNGDGEITPQGSMQFKLRTIFEEIDMQWSWPADVNYHEARAYCAWKSEQDGLKDQEAYRVITEAEHHLIRHPEARPENMAMARDDPTLSLGRTVCGGGLVAGTNANLAFASQSPVDAMPASPTGHHDAMGNAWEWTEDHFNPLEGFEVHYTYDDFSTPCFDGRHHMIMGGSFISKSDNGASGFCRYHFRPHFLQHSGFRLVSSNSPPPARLLHEPEEAVQAAQAVQAGQAPSGSAAGTGAAVAGHAGYETQRLVDQYLGLHFPSSGADEVVGIDFSQAFIDAAEKMKNGEVVRVIRFKVPLEGDLEAEVTAEHEANVTAAARQRAWCQELKDQVDELGTFDGAVLANLLCRLPEPVACAVLGCLLVTCAQATEIVTPFSWLEDFTPKSKWLGGYLKDNKEVHSKDELQRLMEQRGFSKLSEQKLPLVIREHQRKYQYIVPEATVWRR